MVDSIFLHNAILFSIWFLFNILFDDFFIKNILEAYYPHYINLLEMKYNEKSIVALLNLQNMFLTHSDCLIMNLNSEEFNNFINFIRLKKVTFEELKNNKTLFFELRSMYIWAFKKVLAFYSFPF